MAAFANGRPWGRYVYVKPTYRVVSTKKGKRRKRVRSHLRKWPRAQYE
jgi:hypothetical protein